MDSSQRALRAAGKLVHPMFRKKADATPPKKKVKFSKQDSTPAAECTATLVHTSSQASDGCRALPAELWLNIISQCSRDSLKHLSRVSKQIHEITAEFLYAEFDGIIPYYANGQADVHATTVFLRTMAHQPHLLGHMKKATFGQPPLNPKQEVHLLNMSVKAREWMTRRAKPHSFYPMLGDNYKAGTSRITLVTNYLTVVTTLIRMLQKNKNFFNLCLVGVDGWADPEHSGPTVIMSKVRNLNTLSIAGTSIKDARIGRSLLHAMERAKVENFVGISKAFHLHSHREYPILELKTVELQDCRCIGLNHFLRTIRSLEVFKWFAGGFHSSDYGCIIQVLNTLNLEVSTFRTNLQELVIDKSTSVDSWDHPLIISNFGNLRRLTIRAALAFPGFFFPAAESTLKAVTTVDNFMNGLPEGLHYLAITRSSRAFEIHVQHLVAHKTKRHRDLEEINVSFDYLSPGTLEYHTEASSANSTEPYDLEAFAALHGMMILLVNEDEDGQSCATARWTKREGTRLEVQK